MVCKWEIHPPQTLRFVFLHCSTLSSVLDMHNVASCLDVQPDDHFQFYGFSRYARELNELTPELKAVLPPTDTRFRPDQRYRQD